MVQYTVKAGDCLTSIAQAHGLPWEKIWGHGDNSALRSKRKNPNILHPGDRLFIPEAEREQKPAGSGSKHRFRLRNGAARLKVRLQERDAGGDRLDLADQAFVVEFDAGEAVRGRTDGAGRVDVLIPRKATGAKIIVEESGLQIPVQLGYLDPLEEVSGAQGRLKALAYPVGPVDGIVGDLTRQATRMFQQDHELTVDGIIGPETRRALQDAYGS